MNDSSEAGCGWILALLLIGVIVILLTVVVPK